MTLSQKLIIALDYETPEDAYRLVDDLGDEILWYKLGPILFTQHGPEVIRFLHRRSRKIFVDLKLHDTPSIVAYTVRQLAEMGVKLTTVHCMGGRLMLEAAARATRGSDLKLLGLTLLTTNEDPDPQLHRKLLDLAIETRLGGILCSPQDVEDIKNRAWPGFMIVTPGIRLPDQEIFQEDQLRIASPAQALQWGSDFLVMGRPFIQTRDAKGVLERIYRNIQ